MATTRVSHDGQPPSAVPNGEVGIASSIQQRAPYADNPTLGLVPLSATEIFLQRLTGWSQLVKRLINQFEMVVDHQKRLAEAYGRCAKEFAAPVKTKEGDDVFGGGETTQLLFRSIQQSHQKAAQENTEAAAMIETHVVPTLRALLADLRKKASDADREWVGLDKELLRDKDLYVKLTSQLNLSLSKHHGETAESGEKESVVVKDPWAANINIKRHITTCIYKQEHYRQVLLGQQEHFATFEQSIVQTLRITLSTFFDWQSKDLAATQDTFKRLKATLHTLDPVKDWAEFTQRHADRIVEKDVPVVKENEVVYEGRDDPLVSAHKEGLMYRRDTGMKFGFRKNWKETLVVVTAAGYLHALPPAQSAQQQSQQDGEEAKTEPELSLYLPDCMIGPLMMNEKEPEEFVVQEKTAGLFGGERRHKFKGANMDQSAMWWGYLSERVRTTRNRVDMHPASPSPQIPSSSARRASLDVKPAARQSASGGLAIDPLAGSAVATSAATASTAPRPKRDPLGVGTAKQISKPVRLSVQPQPVQPIQPATAVAAETTLKNTSGDQIKTSSDDDDTPLGLSIRIPSQQQKQDEPAPSVQFQTESAKLKLSLTEQMEKALSSAVKEDDDLSSPAHTFGADPWGNPTDLWGSSASLADSFAESAGNASVSSAMARAARLGELEDEDLGGSAWA
ncbi:hypothetical protein SpCBS45565_g03947 [Spizellomyces sp. 'palustris']|nr:hypothetical protein SpCBS45565_g03947 [Spizellomyces sp. 'palustris']